MQRTLETARLRLRSFGEPDLEAYASMCADPEVMRFIGTGVTLNRDEAWRSMATYKSLPMLLIGITLHWAR